MSSVNIPGSTWNRIGLFLGGQSFWTIPIHTCTFLEAFRSTFKCLYLYLHLTFVKFILPSDASRFVASGGDPWAAQAADSKGWEGWVERFVMSGTWRYVCFATNNWKDQYMICCKDICLKSQDWYFPSRLCTSREAYNMDHPQEYSSCDLGVHW